LPSRCFGVLVRSTSPLSCRLTVVLGATGSSPIPAYSGGKPLDLVRLLTPASLPFRALVVCSFSSSFFPAWRHDVWCCWAGWDEWCWRKFERQRKLVYTAGVFYMSESALEVKAKVSRWNNYRVNASVTDLPSHLLWSG
jgi:hypothetical protein